MVDEEMLDDDSGLGEGNLTSATWTIKNIENEVRVAAKLAAKREGKTIYAWVNQVLREGAIRTLKPQETMPTQPLKDLDSLRQDVMNLKGEIQNLVREEMAKGLEPLLGRYLPAKEKAPKQSAKAKSRQKKGAKRKKK
ncbi:MAG: hypothetical protein HQL56_07455 [Magnetococcales bacterium]|nr:hypothetical protein [Magnetococcales bacterium]